MQHTTATQQSFLADQYDAAAPKWHAKINNIGYPAAYRHLVGQAHRLHKLTVVNVLDAGAGCGDFTKALINVVGTPHRLDLLDISSAMLGEARRQLSDFVPNIHTHHNKIEELGLARSFDTILCAHVIEHCEEPVKALRALRAHLDTGGALLLVVSKPHWCTALIRFVWKHKAFRPDQVKVILRDAGFTSIASYSFPKGAPSRTSAGYIASCNKGVIEC